MAFAGDWFVWSDDQLRARNVRTGERVELGGARIVYALATSGDAIAWEDALGIHYTDSATKPARVIAKSTCAGDRSHLRIRDRDVLGVCREISSLPSGIITNVSSGSDAFAFDGAAKRLGSFERDIRYSVTVATFDVEGSSAVMNRHDELVRVRLDGLSDEPKVLHKFGTGFIVYAVRMSSRYVTQLHEHSVEDVCAGAPHHVYAVDVGSPTHVDLGDLREGVTALAANARHVLAAVGEKLYHARPPQALEQVPLDLSPRVDAGSGRRHVTPVISECGTVAINTGGNAILIRGVDAW